MVTDDGVAGSGADRNADGLTPVEQGRLDARIHRANQVLFVAVGGLVLIAALFVVIGFVQPPARHPMALFWLAGAYLVVGTAFFFVLRWWGERRLRRPGPTRDVVVSADRKDLQRVGRRLQSGKTIDEADRLVAQAIVNLNYRKRRLAWLALLLPPIAVVLLLSSRHPGDPIAHIYAGVFLVFAPVAIWLQLRMVRTAAKQGIVPQDRR